MIRRFSLLVGLSSALLASLSIAACGDDDSGSSSATGGGAGDSGTGGGAGDSSTGGSGEEGTHARPPEAGPEVAPDGSGTTVFAINHLFYGVTNPDGTANPINGWKQYGYDVDGKISTATSTDLCKPRNNAAPKNVYPDGNDGIDNSYGRNIVPIMAGVNSDFETKQNEDITSGKSTLMFAIDKLGTADSYGPLTIRLYDGADLGSTPKFDGTDAWPVTAESLSDSGDITTAKVSFEQSYLVDNTLVTAPLGDLTMNALVLGEPVVIHQAVMTLELDAAHENVTRGVISGVISTGEMSDALSAAAGRFDASLCNSLTLDSIVGQIQQASDILVDGTQDPTKACDAISIGLGFTAKSVQLGPVADPVEPSVDPCEE